jgi:uncharacterized membrane protein YhaH (DUF805 family)
MFQILFGEIQGGRLKRLPYLGYYLLLVLLFLVVGIGVGVALGVSERMVGGDLVEAQAIVAERFGVVGIVGVVAVVALILFAQLNLAAKRVRDMGIGAAWLVLFAVLLLVTLASSVLGQEYAGLINLIFFVILVLVPTDAFARGGGSADGGGPGPSNEA